LRRRGRISRDAAEVRREVGTSGIVAALAVAKAEEQDPQVPAGAVRQTAARAGSGDRRREETGDFGSPAVASDACPAGPRRWRDGQPRPQPPDRSALARLPGWWWLFRTGQASGAASGRRAARTTVEAASRREPSTPSLPAASSNPSSPIHHALIAISRYAWRRPGVSARMSASCHP
jgi:hypothetical protein